MRSLGAIGLRPEGWVASSWVGSLSVLTAVDALLVTALATELVAPVFVWLGILPDMVTDVTQLALVAATATAYTEMMGRRQIPASLWAILTLSAVGITVAVGRGQGLVATLWGWWETFRFPLLALYAYLRPRWPEDLPKRLTSLLLAIMALEVIIQAVEYLSGVQPESDNVSGTFGHAGVGPLFFFSLFTVCLALGEWLAHRRWRPLLAALALGMLSGVLAANKFFPVAALLLMVLAIPLYLARGGSLWRMLLLVILLGVGAGGFIIGYDTLVHSATKHSYADYFLDDELRTQYMHPIARSRTSGAYRIGRGAAVGFALDAIGDDAATLVFGYGLGARRESKVLGVTGSALQADRYVRGSDLVVLIQEFGLLSGLVIGGFILWVTVALFRPSRSHPHLPAASLRYALILFSLLWPVWLWYKAPLGSRVAMFLYWGSLGYLFWEARRGEHEGAVEP